MRGGGGCKLVEHVRGFVSPLSYADRCAVTVRKPEDHHDVGTVPGPRGGYFPVSRRRGAWRDLKDNRFSAMAAKDLVEGVVSPLGSHLPSSHPVRVHLMQEARHRLTKDSDFFTASRRDREETCVSLTEAGECVLRLKRLLPAVETSLMPARREVITEKYDLAARVHATPPPPRATPASRQRAAQLG